MRAGYILLATLVCITGSSSIKETNTIRRTAVVDDEARFSYASLTALDKRTLSKLKAQSASSVQKTGIMNQQHYNRLKSLFSLRVSNKNKP